MNNLKLSILAVAMSFFSGLTFSQAINQQQLLETIGEGSFFRNYYSITTENGVTTGGAGSYDYDLKFEKDIPTRGYAFEMYKTGTNDVKINSSFGFLEPDHFTEPSAFCNGSNAYVYLNGLLYGLENYKNENGAVSFKIDEIYVLWKPAKESAHLSGKAALKEMKSRDHKAAIKAYLAEMAPIQENATANFSEETKNKLVMIEQAKIDKRNGIQAKNAAYWNSEEGQRVLAKSRQAEVTLVNDTGSTLYICYGSGAYDDLKPGEKKTFSCSGGKVYRGTLRPNNSSQYDSTDNVLIDRNGQNCGAVINASTVIRY